MTLTTILILAMLGTFFRDPETLQYPETPVDFAIPGPTFGRELLTDVIAWRHSPDDETREITPDPMLPVPIR
jgi:hypothetical protein